MFKLMCHLKIRNILVIDNTREQRCVCVCVCEERKRERERERETKTERDKYLLLS